MRRNESSKLFSDLFHHSSATKLNTVHGWLMTRMCWVTSKPGGMQEKAQADRTWLWDPAVGEVELRFSGGQQVRHIRVQKVLAE